LVSGSADSFCVGGCQGGIFGECKGVSVRDSWPKAAAGGQFDSVNGTMWYIDQESNVFWSWDTTAIIKDKFTQIIKPLGLGGVMAWSLGEDSQDWSHITTIRDAAGN